MLLSIWYLYGKCVYALATAATTYSIYILFFRFLYFFLFSVVVVIVVVVVDLDLFSLLVCASISLAVLDSLRAYSPFTYIQM